MRSSQRHILISAVTLVVLLLGVMAAAPWLATHGIDHVAKARGWNVRVEGRRIGWRGIWFDRIEIKASQQASLLAEINHTCIGWSSVFGTRRLSVGSGRLELTGTADELRKLLNARGNAGTTGSLGTRDIQYDAHHLDVEWRERAELPNQVSIRNLEVHKSDQGVTAQAATLVARRGAAVVELKGAVVKPKDEPRSASTVDGERPPWHLVAAEVLVQFDASSSVDSAKDTHKAEQAKHDDAPRSSAPITEGASKQGGASPAARALPGGSALRPENSVQKPRLAAASAKPSPHSAFFPGLVWLLDEVEHLKTDMAVSAADSNARGANFTDRIAVGTAFESPALRVRVVDQGQKLELGPWPLRAERAEQEYNIEVSQNATVEQSALTAKLALTERLERGKLTLAVGPITLPQLGATEGDFGLENIAATRLEIDARAEFESASGELSVESKGWVEHLSLRQPYLARETVKNIGFMWEGAITLDAAKRQLKSNLLRLSIGPVSAKLRGTVEVGRDYQSLTGKLDVPLAACQDLFNVLPEGLAPHLRGWRLERSFALQLNVAFDSRKPNKASVGLTLDNGCRVVSVPNEVAPRRFEQPFALDVEDEQGAVQAMGFGPGTWGWTPLVAVSPYIESAVLVCEDGRFLYHDGFDREAIQNSIRENLRTMRFARGGSTVSMQLAKNLYLRRDKTVARKLQEAALTMLLEQSFSKRQLLELYLNVIEFGPGIYGIGPAAKHYFETTPERLTLAQSFFLMSILPNPKAQHFGSDGFVRPGWMNLLRNLMTIGHKRGHFSQAELEAGLAEQLAYRVQGNPVLAPTHRMLQIPGAALDDEATPRLGDDE